MLPCANPLILGPPDFRRDIQFHPVRASRDMAVTWRAGIPDLTTGCTLSVPRMDFSGPGVQCTPQLARGLVELRLSPANDKSVRPIRARSSTHTFFGAHVDMLPRDEAQHPADAPFFVPARPHFRFRLPPAPPSDFASAPIRAASCGDPRRTRKALAASSESRTGAQRGLHVTNVTAAAFRSAPRFCGVHLYFFSTKGGEKSNRDRSREPRRNQPTSKDSSCECPVMMS